jgi:3',5'-cyclic AMP phosphodiesterase CpdA
MRRLAVFAAGAAIVAVARCGGNTATGPSPPPAAGESVLVGAGDIALCSALAPAEATAKLLDAIPGTVFTAGDNVQAVGAMEEFRQCFDPTWGRHKTRMQPSPGNHDYATAGGAAYFEYFGGIAGSPGASYYSYDLGSWHIISLDSNIAAGPGSPQLEWLAKDLKTAWTQCTLAYFHHPLFTSGPNGPNVAVQDMWRVLYARGVDVIVNGHDHLYERFRLQDPDGQPDSAHGIREFIAGTGGAPLYQAVRVAANSEVRASVHGVLKLILRNGTYDWVFVSVAGQPFRDSGTDACH